MLRTIIRFLVSAVVLMVTGFLVPGFRVANFTVALIAAVVIAALGYLIESMFGDKVSPQNRGLVGFLVSALVIYVTQFIMPGIRVSLIGALLAALVIGIIDAIVPTTLR